MYAFIKDILFVEQLKDFHFTQTCAVTLVEDTKFYAGKTDGIYQYFRSNQSVSGKIFKPTGKKKNFITVNRSHQIIWDFLDTVDGKERKFYIVTIDDTPENAISVSMTFQPKRTPRITHY